jgi:hypothetical protein
MTTADGTPAHDALRDLVREVLRDVLPTLAARNGSQSAPPVGGSLPADQPVSAMLPRSPAVPAAPPTSDPAPSWPARTTPASGATGAEGAAAMAGAAGAYETPSGVTMQPVRLATDADLHDFVLQIVRLADNPKRRRDLVAGRLRFTLAATDSAPAPPGFGPGPGHARATWSDDGRESAVPAERGRAGASGGDHRIERGAVTERAVQAAASAGARLVLGPRAVLTPLARDRARALGVPIEKER